MAKRLWSLGADQGGGGLDEAILRFTVGDDPTLDAELLPHDCLASAAHVRMLERIGILSGEELVDLVGALREAYALSCARALPIAVEQEDGHTALEMFLTERLGDVGRKVHTGRSRNDQVIAAVRLFVREQLLELSDSTLGLALVCTDLGSTYAKVPMPGYTHTRRGMPSSVGQYFFAVAEGLFRDLETFHAPMRIAARSALGSASGYGVPVDLDRGYVAELLGLAAVDHNTIYVQNTRGRLEALVLTALHQLALTLGRMSNDLIWLSSEAYGFFALPALLTTGSSIMPQKRNPDVLELVRALPASMLGRYVEVTGVVDGLAPGYHRDLQRVKGPLMAGLREMADVLLVVQKTLPQLEVNEARCLAHMSPEIFATDRVYAKVREGQPFRAAYLEVKAEDNAGHVEEVPEDMLAHRNHIGVPGSDQGEWLRCIAEEARKSMSAHRAGAEKARSLLA